MHRGRRASPHADARALPRQPVEIDADRERVPRCDRDERAGVKCKDADLIGIPYRITIGKKAADSIVELYDRRAKQSEDVKISDVVSRVQQLARS